MRFGQYNVCIALKRNHDGQQEKQEYPKSTHGWTLALAIAWRKPYFPTCRRFRE
jgi:hypothetical protein